MQPIGSTFPFFSNINLSWLAYTPLLLVVFAVFSIVYAVVSVVLMYHWWAYGMRSAGILVGATVFLFVSMVFFGIAVSALSII